MELVLGVMLKCLAIAIAAWGGLVIMQKIDEKNKE